MHTSLANLEDQMQMFSAADNDSDRIAPIYLEDIRKMMGSAPDAKSMGMIFAIASDWTRTESALRLLDRTGACRQAWERSGSQVDTGQIDIGQIDIGKPPADRGPGHAASGFLICARRPPWHGDRHKRSRRAVSFNPCPFASRA